MAAQIRSLPRFAVGLVALLVLQAGCSPKVTAPPEPPYTVRRGDEAFRYQDYKGAITSYRSYLDETQKDAYTARVFYKTALAEYRLGRYQDSLITLDQLQQRYPKGHWVQVDALRGDAERELDRPMAALKAWDEGWEVGNDNDRRKLRQRIVTLARGLTDSQIAQAQRIVENDEVRTLLEQQIALRRPGIEEPIPEGEGPSGDEGLLVEPSRAVQGKGPQPQPTPRVVAQHAAPPTIAGHATAPGRVEAPSPREVPPPEAPIAAATPLAAAALKEERLPEAKPQGQLKVGCLLPLSGSAKDLGTRALRGLRLLFGENSDRLIVMDTANDAATALQMFNRLSRNPEVVAVIGPLRSEDAETVAPVARQAQLPLFLLSPHDGLAGESVVQVGATRSRLVATVLQYAMDKVHMQRFGILYPSDDTGKQYLATFRSEAERRGGTIVGVDAYSPRTPGLPPVTLKRWHDGQHLQAIFLPADVSAARRVVQVLQRDTPDITLLGVSGWESLAGPGNDGASGVLFSDGFYSGSTDPGTQQFVARFQQAYGERPGVVEAQAYDAGLLAQTALDAGAGSRAEVLPTLQSYGPIAGATGQLTVSRAGLDSRLFLLQVYDGKVQEVSAGTS